MQNISLKRYSRSGTYLFLAGRRRPRIAQEVQWYYESIEASECQDHPQEDESGSVALVKRSLEGDEQAFAQIVERYGNLLLRTAYLIVNDEETAKDVVQDTFILAWKKLPTLREPAFLRAWLLKITVNEAVSFRRQFVRHTKAIREIVAQSWITTSITLADFQRGQVEETLDIKKAIDLLPTNQRILIVLVYYHHMSMAEISLSLGVAENTLRKRLQSALGKLSRVLSTPEIKSPDAELATSYFHPQRTVNKGDIS